jgi:hypothetical protein
MQRDVFDMRGDAPNRDRINIELKTNSEAIECNEMARDLPR